MIGMTPLCIKKGFHSGRNPVYAMVQISDDNNNQGPGWLFHFRAIHIMQHHQSL